MFRLSTIRDLIAQAPYYTKVRGSLNIIHLCVIEDLIGLDPYCTNKKRTQNVPNVL